MGKRGYGRVYAAGLGYVFTFSGISLGYNAQVGLHRGIRQNIKFGV